MKTSTGIVGVFLAVGALVVSSAHSKTAEARSGAHASVPAASVSALPLTAPVVASTVIAAREVTASTPVTQSAPVPSLPTLAPPRTLRRMQTCELTPAMMQAAAQVVRQYYAKPVGTNVDIQVDGKHFVARIERHYHPEGGPIKPWGFHPGVSLFALR